MTKLNGLSLSRALKSQREEYYLRLERLESRIESLEAERAALREALAKADDLAGAIENDVRQSTQTRFALTAYHEARDALKTQKEEKK